MDADPLAVTFKPRDCYTRHGTEKIKWFSRKEAKRAARQTRGNASAYRCGVCGYWHTGNAAPRSVP